VKRLSCVPLIGKVLALHTNIIPGRKSVPGTNTLVFLRPLTNYGRKKFWKNVVTIGQKVNMLKDI